LSFENPLEERVRSLVVWPGVTSIAFWYFWKGSEAMSMRVVPSKEGSEDELSL